MSKVISVFGSNPTFEEGFIKAGYECHGVMCQTPETREAYKAHFENTITFIFSENANHSCSCGVNNRKPDGIIGKLPTETPEGQERKAAKVQYCNDFAKMLSISNKPEFFVFEFEKELIDNKEEFESITPILGNAGFDLFIQAYNSGRMFIVGFNQEYPVKDFEFPVVDEESTETEFDVFTKALAEQIKITVTESGKKVEELFRQEES